MATYTLDATNKKLGRIASEAARLILGKNSPSVKRNETANVRVVIENASKAFITDVKKRDKTYKRYSGYPGGLYSASMADVITKKGYGELFKTAVYGMLPTNKLRAKRIKNLIVKE